MQQRFPQVAVVTINQRDFGLFITAQLFTQLGSQLQPTGTTTHNHYFFQWRSHATP